MSRSYLNADNDQGPSHGLAMKIDNMYSVSFAERVSQNQTLKEKDEQIAALVKSSVRFECTSPCC